MLSLTGAAVSGIERRSGLILLLASLGIYDTRIGVALSHASVIGVKALELSEGGVDGAVEGAVNSVLKGAERIAAESKVSWRFRHHRSAIWYINSYASLEHSLTSMSGSCLITLLTLLVLGHLSSTSSRGRDFFALLTNSAP